MPSNQVRPLSAFGSIRLRRISYTQPNPPTSPPAAPLRACGAGRAQPLASDPVRPEPSSAARPGPSQGARYFLKVYELGSFSGLVEEGSQFCRHPVGLMRVVWGCVPHSPNRYAFRPWQNLRQAIEGIRQIPGALGTAEKKHITRQCRESLQRARRIADCPNIVVHGLDQFADGHGAWWRWSVRS